MLAAGGDGDGTSASLTREPSSRPKPMAMSGSSRTMSFSPNMIRTTSGYDQKQREGQEETAPEMQKDPLAEDKDAERIESVNSMESAKSGEEAADKDKEKPSEPVAAENELTAATHTESAGLPSLESAVEAPPGGAEGGDDDKGEPSSSHRKNEAPSSSKPKYRKKEHSPKKAKRKEKADDVNEDNASSSRAASTPGFALRVNGVDGPEEGQVAASSFSDAPNHQGKDHHRIVGEDDEGDDAQRKTSTLDTSGGEAKALNLLELTRKELESGSQHQHREDHTKAESSAIADGDDWDEPSPTNVLSSESTGIKNCSVLKTASALEPLPSLPATAPVESEDAPSSSPKKERWKKKKTATRARKASIVR